MRFPPRGLALFTSVLQTGERMSIFTKLDKVGKDSSATSKRSAMRSRRP